MQRRHRAGAAGAMTPRADRRRQRGASRARAARSIAAMRILPRAQRQAMYEVYAFCRAVDDIADEAGDRGRSASRSSTQWRRDIDALYRRRRRRHSSPSLAQRGARLRLAARGFPRRHRRHGDGRATAISARPTSRRSISIATAWRARSGRLSVRGLRHAGERGHRRSPIISAAPCSSPISCATSTRTPRIGRLYLPREALAERRHHRHRTRRRCWRMPRSARACADGGRARRAFRRRPTRSWRASPRAMVRAPRIMGAAYRRILRGAGGARLGGAARTRASSASCAFAQIRSCVTRRMTGAHGPHHRRRSRRPVRRRAAGASGPARRRARGGARRPAAAAAPIFDPALDMHDRQRQSLLLSGNRGALAYLARSAATDRMRGPDEADFRFRRSRQPASAGPCGSTTAPSRGGFSPTAAACRTPRVRDYLALARLLVRPAARPSAR